MASPQSSQTADVLLEQWFQESDPTRARTTLESLIGSHAEPLIRRVVTYKLEAVAGSRDRSGRRADIDDVCGTALYNLLARLQRIKSEDNQPAIRNFCGYAAVTAYNACNEFFRNKRPAWVGLSAKVRYLVTHAPQFALWQADDGRDVCGFPGDRGRDPNSDPVRLSEACRKHRQRQDPARLNLAELVDTILDAAAAPLTLEHLVDAVAEWSGVKEARIQSLDEEPSQGVSRWEPADGKPLAESRLRERQYIERLWKEICELPVEHRKALLFNLQDGAGGDIQLFEFLGIATISQIATAVEMAPLTFAELWKRLPIDDGSIGRELGLSRQDVANRRSAARKRLARKMKEFGDGN
jgi:hypothetical protein